MLPDQLSVTTADRIPAFQYNWTQSVNVRASYKMIFTLYAPLPPLFSLLLWCDEEEKGEEKKREERREREREREREKERKRE